MALPRNSQLGETLAVAHMADITTGTPAGYTTATRKGRIISIKAAAQGTLAGSDTVLTVSINGTNITGGTITLTAGAAGSGYATDLSAVRDGTNLVSEGDKIKFLSDGGSNDSTVACNCIAVISSRLA
jgi:hypothetical protein